MFFWLILGPRICGYRYTPSSHTVATEHCLQLGSHSVATEASDSALHWLALHKAVSADILYTTVSAQYGLSIIWRKDLS